MAVPYWNEGNDPVKHEIMVARVKMLVEMPFFGYLATGLIAVDASTWCDTAATDGVHLFYNREFIKSLSRPELLFLIGHEVLHCCFNHLARRQGRDAALYNMACDYIINWVLRDAKVGTMPKSGLYDAKYTDAMSSEEVYDLLKKNSVTIKAPLDMHLDLTPGDSDSPDDGNGQSEVSVTVLGKDGPPKLSEADLQKIQNKLRAAMIQAAQQPNAGNIPRSVKRMIQELTTPKIDWRALLDSHIRSSVKDDYTFQRISRRSWGAGLLLPAQDYIETIEIDVAIDVSASLTEAMIRDQLSETAGIMLTFRDFRLRVWTFDTEVHNVQCFTPENIEDIYQYEITGGGGTMFECNWEYMKREGIEPKRFVVFTDGQPNSTWGDAEYCDTLFVIHGSTSIVAPFGMTAYYDIERPHQRRAA